MFFILDTYVILMMGKIKFIIYSLIKQHKIYTSHKSLVSHDLT